MDVGALREQKVKNVRDTIGDWVVDIDIGVDTRNVGSHPDIVGRRQPESDLWQKA